MPGNVERFLRRAFSDEEARAALERKSAPVVTSDQRLGMKCPHGAKDWTYCSACTDAADRDDG